ncbi:MAG: DUF3617 family protein [Bryobacteraceae bacterium]|jgi:hypothetical protein
MNKTLILAAAAFLLAIGTAYAVDPPDLKEGLWSVHSQSIDNPGNKTSSGTYTLCRSHAFDQAVRGSAKNLKGCTVSENFQSGKYSSATHCIVANTVIEGKGTTTFQGDSSFRTESHATYTPAMHGVSETTIIMDQKYLGSCPAGAQPGDRTNADGTVIHLGKH